MVRGRGFGLSLCGAGPCRPRLRQVPAPDLLCREWFQHPDGELPAYEWDFSDVNPPVQAWGALEVFAIDGGHDTDFLSRIFDKLLVNFTWWVNRRDLSGSNVFEGGFLGLDNIGPIDRSHIPAGATLQQSDATGWMAMYALVMGAIAGVLDRAGQRPGQDLVLKFLEHFAAIRTSMESRGMWDEADGLYYDRLVTGDGTIIPFRVRSMVGIIPTLAVLVLDEELVGKAAGLGKGFARFLQGEGLGELEKLKGQGLLRGEAGAQRLLLGVVSIEHLERILAKVLDEDEFLSPYGLRALSAFHKDQPYDVDTNGIRASIDYEPAESTTNMFGGNSNWRGPVWFPLNYMKIEALERYDRFFGDDLKVEYPTSSGNKMTLGDIAQDFFAGASSHCSWRGTTAGALVSAMSLSSRPAPCGKTTCCSMSTSTGTTVQAWAPRTRPGGRGSSPTWCGAVMERSLNWATSCARSRAQRKSAASPGPHLWLWPILSDCQMPLMASWTSSTVVLGTIVVVFAPFSLLQIALLDW